jgi:small subunit ribosomal protein S17
MSDTEETPAETAPDPGSESTAETVQAETAASAPGTSTSGAGTPIPAEVDVQEHRGARKVREGTVISDKMQSTVVVAVIERVRHARYGKTVQRTKKLYAHDDKFEARTGDRVRVAESRPRSKLKRWRVTEVVERAR